MQTKEMIEALVKALEAGAYNVTPSSDVVEKYDEKYPHKCPRCKGPAYVGFSDVDCKNKC